MKKTTRAKIRQALICLTLAATTVIPAAAQEETKTKNDPPFSEGSGILGVSAGFGIDYNYYGDVSRSPAFALSFEKGKFDIGDVGTIGVGGLIGFKNATYHYGSGDYKATWTNFIIASRFTFHLSILKDKNNKFDPYAGIMLGIRINSYDDTYYTGYNPYSYGSIYFTKGLFVGAQYKFLKHLAAFSELGYDISVFRIGLNLNFDGHGS